MRRFQNVYECSVLGFSMEDNFALQETHGNV